MARLDVELAALATMSQPQLQREWQAHFNEEAPDVPASMLARAIAYHLQAEGYGDLPLAGQQMLDGIAGGVSVEPEIQLKPGSRLLREWQGKLHTVSVNERDFVLDGKSYGSLSEVARHITGTRWSGPRFFGIKKRPPPPSRKVAANG